MTGLEELDRRIEHLVELVTGSLFKGHVAVDHQPSLQVSNRATTGTQLQAERLLGRKVPTTPRCYELFVVGNGQLQVVGGVDRQDRFDSVHEAQSAGSVAC